MMDDLTLKRRFIDDIYREGKKFLGAIATDLKLNGYEKDILIGLGVSKTAINEVEIRWKQFIKEEKETIPLPFN